MTNMDDNHHHEENPTATKQSPLAVIAVPFPAQGHLNQMLQLSSLISGYGLPVFYVASASHNRQAQVRTTTTTTTLDPQTLTNIHFHDIPTPPFLSPPPNPNSINKFPRQLQPAADATLHLRLPFAAYLQEMAQKFTRVVVVYDSLMSYVVQDVAEIHSAESYQLVCVSAISNISFTCGFLGLPFPLPHPKELPPFDEWMSQDFINFVVKQSEPSQLRSGKIYNTSRLIEAPYVEALEKEEDNKKKPIWAVGPILPTPSPPTSNNSKRHECLNWLDKQEPKSVIFVSFGTTVSLSDEEITELSLGLERSKVKFLWVVRDADRSDVFEGEARRAELPEGFRERVGEDQGMVMREWAPQPQILAHPSIGGFMSHCGWNSCIESMTMGVAIAAWPMHSDQPSNAALIADILKTGVVVREWKDRLQLVKASTVETAVRILMASQQGVEIRKRAEELGVALRRATKPGGASRLELDSFIAHITRN